MGLIEIASGNSVWRGMDYPFAIVRLPKDGGWYANI